MNIRHVLPGFGRMPSNPESGSMSGIVGVAYNLAYQQAASGWEAEVMGLAGPDERAGVVMWSDRLRGLPVRPWAWCQLGSYDFRYFAPAAARLLLSSRVDVHHVYSNPYLLAPGRADVRVLHYQTPIAEARPADERAVGRANAVICCSVFVRRQFQQQVKYPADCVYVVYNGVDLERFRLGDKQASRARLGIPRNEAVILFAGQVNEEKGLLHLVRACRLLASEHDFHLIVAGSSRLWGGADNLLERTAYERQVEEEASGLAATFLGKLAYGVMPDVYRSADVFVCPSVWDEPLGMVNLEAMATGLPVVAAQTGGISEVVVHGVTGFLVPPADPGALAEALRALLRDRVLRQQFGAAGLKRARDFGWHAIAGQVQRIYLEAKSRRCVA